MRRRSIFAALAAALVLPAGAPAASESALEVDTSAYPIVRAVLVSDEPSTVPPMLEENGQRVEDVTATNLGEAKSVVLAVDRSRSMLGQPVEDAVAAGAAFLAAK
ncbi:MAG: hypothetical protein ACRDNC_00315, partial [Gaiellaceae bacterium]